jgi:hypothetical protein
MAKMSKINRIEEMRFLAYKFLREPKTFHIPLSYLFNSALLAFLGVFTYTTFSYAAQVTLGWDANTNQDLAGYIIHKGTSSRNYDASMDIGNWTSATIANLADNETYYFAVAAYDTDGIESEYSNEVCINCQTSSGANDGGGG